MGTRTSNNENSQVVHSVQLPEGIVAPGLERGRNECYPKTKSAGAQEDNQSREALEPSDASGGCGSDRHIGCNEETNEGDRALRRARMLRLTLAAIDEQKREAIYMISCSSAPESYLSPKHGSNGFFSMIY